MNRWVVLGLSMLLVASGCSSKGGPSSGQPQPPAQAVTSTVNPQETNKSSVVTPESSKPAQAVNPEPDKSKEAKSETAKPDAKQQEQSHDVSQAGPAPTVAAQPPSVASVPTQQDTVAAPTPKNTELKISITGDTKHGVILKETSVPFQEGATVIDVLKKVTKVNQIQMESNGKGIYTYVQGIDNLYEFDEGPKSGWVYKVNGRAPGEGAGSYKAAAGDKIEWLYTLNLGKDVGAEIK